MLQSLAVHAVAAIRLLGGQGSGNYGHAGRPGEKGGSERGVGGVAQQEKTRNARSTRALKAFKPITAENQQYAEKNELHIRGLIGHNAIRTKDNLPVDVIVTIAGKVHGIEVKTMINNTRDQITMRKAALSKKRSWSRKNNAKTHTVVLDDRDRFHGSAAHYSGHRIYYARGTASFRLGGMVRVQNGAHLVALLSGKVRS